MLFAAADCRLWTLPAPDQLLRSATVSAPGPHKRRPGVVGGSGAGAPIRDDALASAGWGAAWPRIAAAVGPPSPRPAPAPGSRRRPLRDSPTAVSPTSLSNPHLQHPSISPPFASPD